MYPESVIIEPLLTEKSNEHKEHNKYLFKVLLSANKLQIKQAIRILYNVVPLSCNIVNVKGKKKRQGKSVGKTSRYKKAIVELRKEDTIAVFEGA